jgi:DNA-binding MarR family transcriptional regulator
MSIEDDIQQPSFRSETQKALVNLFFTNNFLVSEMNEFFKEYDITRQQYNVLRILRGQHPNPASVNLIKERMLDKMSDASRIVERLRLKGLVERSVNSTDRRSAEVRISKQGLKLLAKTDDQVRGYEEIFLKLSPEELKMFNLLLDKLRS